MYHHWMQSPIPQCFPNQSLLSCLQNQYQQSRPPSLCILSHLRCFSSFGKGPNCCSKLNHCWPGHSFLVFSACRQERQSSPRFGWPRISDMDWYACWRQWDYRDIGYLKEFFPSFQFASYWKCPSKRWSFSCLSASQTWRAQTNPSPLFLAWPPFPIIWYRVWRCTVHSCLTCWYASAPRNRWIETSSLLFWTHIC